ncbi:threonine/serine exporter family protein [Gryllotalpicola protaetiae]|nr:threonine/serine exporter family protein [Gryllotalpicola protaetiae]
MTQSDGARGTTLGRLGALLLDAGVSVTDVRDSLTHIDGGRMPALSFSVMPELVIVSDRDSGLAPVVATTQDELSFRQAARANQLARALELGALPLAAAPDEISAVRAMVRRHPQLGWVVGSTLTSVGLAVLTRSPWWSVLVAVLVGAVVGAVTVAMGRIAAAAAIVPFAATLVSTLMVGSFAHVAGIAQVPLFAVCAPIAILVPGAVITNALLELTATDIVTGSARLVYGLVVLGFMVAGVTAGVALTGLHLDPHSAGLIGQFAIAGPEHAGWSALPPLWLAWIGIVPLAIGVGLAFGSTPALTGVSVITMACAYGVLSALTPLVGKVVATGATAAALLIVARLIAQRALAAPASITFQPAFLLLVPGTVGLVAFASMDVARVADAVETFVSLCVGAKVGALFTAFHPSRRLDGDSPGRTS